MDSVLNEIDQLLDDESLYQLIRNDLAKRYPQTEPTGRNATPLGSDLAHTVSQAAV
jgi:hypothetical protein